MPPPPAAGIKKLRLYGPRAGIRHNPSTFICVYDGKKKKKRCKFSAMLAARSVIQQQMDLTVLPGARPADEIPSKAEAGHSPPKMARGIKEC